MKRMVIYNGLVMISGVFFGVIAYFCLPAAQLALIQDFFGQSIQEIASTLRRGAAIYSIFQTNLMDILRLYFFGLCLVGLPLLFVFIFAKGFSLGFFCCFLSGQSLLLTGVQLCYLPVYIFAGSWATYFALLLLRNRMENPVGQAVQYTILFILLTLLLLALSCLDGSISTLVLQKMV